MAKTFAELFAGTGIEPTTDKDGGVHYNFNATLKNKPMKLYTEEQLQEAYNRGLMDGRLNNVDYSIPDGFTPIELPTDEEIEKGALEWCLGVDERGTRNTGDDYDNHELPAFIAACKWMKEQILNQNK